MGEVRRIRWPAVAAAGAAIVLTVWVVLVGGARPAGAELNGPCEASGTILETGLTIDPSAGDGPFEVPLEGTVDWAGQVGDGGATPERSTDGEITVVAPPLLKEIIQGVLVVRDWNDNDSTTTAESGVDTYTLPDYTPRGTELVVSGFHTDEVGDCDGQVTIVVEGSAFDSPITIASLAGTVISGAGVVAAAVARGPR